MQKKYFKEGFTLIEMLIVIVVIGILAAALVPKFMNTQERARDVVRVVKIRDTANAIDLYAEDNGGKYPLAAFYTYSPIREIKTARINPLKEFFSFAPHVLAASTYSTTAMIAAQLTQYISSMPTDNKGTIAYSDGSCVLSGDSFGYYTNPDASTYAITANMETNKGNTTNCIGLVDREKEGSYQVVGRGLKYNISSATSTPPEEVDICTLLDNPSTYLGKRIITNGVLLQSGSVLHPPLTFSLEYDCQVDVSAWLSTAILRCPPDNPSCVLPPTMYNLVNKMLHLEGTFTQPSASTYSINSINNVTVIE